MAELKGRGEFARGTAAGTVTSGVIDLNNVAAGTPNVLIVCCAYWDGTGVTDRITAVEFFNGTSWVALTERLVTPGTGDQYKTTSWELTGANLVVHALNELRITTSEAISEGIGSTWSAWDGVNTASIQYSRNGTDAGVSPTALTLNFAGGTTGDKLYVFGACYFDVTADYTVQTQTSLGEALNTNSVDHGHAYKDWSAGSTVGVTFTRTGTVFASIIGIFLPSGAAPETPAKALYFCKTVNHPLAPPSRGIKIPKVYEWALSNSLLDMTGMQVAPTSAFACGVVNVTPTQFNTLAADADIFMRWATDYTTETVGGMSGADRTKFDGLQSSVGLTSGGTLSFGAIGTGANGTTSCTPSYPTGITTASALYLVVTGRSNTEANVPAVTGGGWTIVHNIVGGTGTWGVDTGTRRVTVFRKDTVTGTESGTITVTLAGTTANTMRASIFRVQIPAGAAITEQAVSGADTTHNTAWSVTGGNITWNAGDLLLVMTAQSTDSATQSAQNISASGVTFGTRTNRASVAVTSGNDHRHVIDDIPVTAAGAPSAPTWSHTNSANASGVTVFLRLSSIAPLAVSGDTLGQAWNKFITTQEPEMSMSGMLTRYTQIFEGSPPPPSGVSWPLSVHASGRYLVDSQGTPFFVHGDTPWAIEAQLTTAQVDTYLNDRQTKGFNAILFECMEHLFSSQNPAYRNANGDDPFSPMTDFASRVTAYWNHVAYIVDQAKARDIVCFITPAYAGFAGGGEGWRTEIEAESDADLQNYGAFLQNTLGVKGNVIWVMGGDWGGNPTFNAKQWNIATGIRSVNPNVLITGHGARTEEAYPIWSGFTGFNLNNIYTNGVEYTFAATAYARNPAMPFFLSEGYYDGESATQADCRRQAYASILSGACGHFFGNNPIWGFGEPNANGGAGPAAALSSALNTTATQQMAYVKALFTAYSWHLLEPRTDTSLVTTALGSGTGRICPARASNGSFAMIWTTGTGFTVDMTALTPSSVRARWYNTTDGSYSFIANYPNTGTQAFSPPGERVLVLDAA